jgi:inward rectifier potassium channel
MSIQPPAFPETTRPSYDPGFTQKYNGTIKRTINKDGAFNVKRAGRTWRDIHPYMYLINTSWPTFGVIVTSVFSLVNIGFALLYWAAGVDNIKGAAGDTPLLVFLNLFFFSWHTLTTVGYGNMYPQGVAANAIASLEALLGLMAFAVATGLMFGRFSRPTARFGFSERAVIAPYRNGLSLQFRVVNRRANNLIEVDARVTLMTVELVNGKAERRFTPLDLERTNILFFPLTWTVVHPIIETSPLWGKSKEDLARLQAEVIIMIRGFDDTFGQIVHAKYSYRYDEILWGAKFAAAFEIDPEGDLLLWVDKVGVTEPAALPSPAESSA